MTERDLIDARQALRAGAPVPQPVLEELRSAVAGLVRSRSLPPSYAPYGVWNVEAEDDVFQGWFADRLVARGKLQALLDRARTPAALRRMAEKSVRQWLLNQRARTQSQNLYARAGELLLGDDRFVCARREERASRSSWTLRDAEQEDEWAGSDDQLVSIGYALGDFEIVRYRGDAKKLAPVLNNDDLGRFIEGLLATCKARLTLSAIARTLKTVFMLDDVIVEPLDNVLHPQHPGPDPGEQVVLMADVRAIIAELTARQSNVLLAARAGIPWETTAAELNCSAATVINEHRRIGRIIERFAANDGERDLLLRMTGDALYEGQAIP
ncbi:MAG: hypothetical protein QOG15_1959 [Solirubrobacteraceae bacterium]|jgi:hypothetical protein|nr:hypothetical protein [Solirubrobacteraceae bacterium]